MLKTMIKNITFSVLFLLGTACSIDQMYFDEYNEDFDNPSASRVSRSKSRAKPRVSTNSGKLKKIASADITPREVLERMDTVGNYDIIGRYEPVSKAEVQMVAQKWYSGNVDNFLRNYKGHTIRIEKLRNNNELKEIRLKFVYNNDDAAAPNKRIVDILNEVADQIVLSTCGVDSKPLIIYNKSSFDLSKPTQFYDYEVKRESAVREYAFRCLF